MATTTRLGLYGGARAFLARPTIAPPIDTKQHTRLGLYGGARAFLDRPLADIPVAPPQITRLGLYGGVRPFLFRPVAGPQPPQAPVLAKRTPGGATFIESQVTAEKERLERLRREDEEILTIIMMAYTHGMLDS